MYITGVDARQYQFLPLSIAEMINLDNPVRAIASFADHLDFKALAFKREYPSYTGRHGYNPRDLLKLYIYGYFNRLRSSRCLMRECTRNIEVMFFMNNLQHDFRTIADFRKDNSKPIQQVFIKNI